jgi:CheY-like chemotaxis protein
MTPSLPSKELAIRVVVAGLLLGIFFIDLLTPLGFADWALYLVPVAVTLFQRAPLMPLFTVGVASVLSVVGYFGSPPGIDPMMAVVNRAIGGVSMWVAAGVVWHVLTARRRLQDLLWLQHGEATVAHALLGEQSPEQIAAQAAGALCRYLGADIAVAYRLDGERLLRLGGHAFDAQATPEQLPASQGLVGEVLRSGQAQATADVPPGHLSLVSALGRSEPRHLLIAPLTAERQLCGVLELGFVGRAVALDRARALLAEVAEPIGMALRAALYRGRLVELLEETQRQSEALQAQQEELRVSNEELEEQSRVLQSSQAQLETQQFELEQTNVQLEEQTQALERQKQHLLATQDQLQANALKLEAASRYKSEFLANMSHELRTPLNSALILSKLLADNRDDTLTAEQVKYAQAIYASNNDLLNLINDILDLSKIEAGHVELQAEPVPLAGLVERLQATFEPLAAHKRLAFRIEQAPGTPVQMVSDAQRLQQVLKNLLANAIKFTERGQVVLRLAPGRGERIRFEVQDSGIGIAKSQQAVIFEAFRQADGSTSRRFGGTGLGLSISRELARRLGGDIQVDSEPGRGSTFTLELPLVLAAQAPAEPVAASVPVASPPPPPPQPEPAPPAPLQRRHPGRLILAVEDDVRFAEVLKDLAAELQFDCVVAPSAAEALQLARELQPSGILLDVGLPDASGLSVLERLKRDPATRHVPVHMVSLHERVHAAMELGAVGYLQKPAAREDLVAAIGKLEERLQQRVRRVLIVEDDAALRDNLTLLLKGEQVQITAVGTVADALAQLAAASFDCMVMDLTLPDGSGDELLERMAASEQYGFPPVIVYTGRALSRDEEQRLRRHSKSIIVKGARSPERLLDEVTLFLHSVEASLPADQQRLLRQARRRDAVLDGRRLLVAEDDVRNIFALSSVFEPLGAVLEIARNGREAIERLEQGDIDLVLMDIMMPEMDGLTAMREIRKRPQWANLPIIALTAKAMADDREQCLEAGANDYIAKPIDVEKLVSLTRVWCPK